MSEEILKALMQLFAIIAKQDEGAAANEIDYVHTFLTQQVSSDVVEEYMNLFREKIGGEDKEEGEEGEKKKKRLTSVKDSVKILGLCKKINKTLNQKQKVVVLVRLFELVNADRKFSDQRMAIINTVAEVFNIDKDEFKSVETFVVQSDFKSLDNPYILIANDEINNNETSKFIETEPIGGSLFILQVKSVDLYFLRYTGHLDLFLNGLAINQRRIYLFANGSTIKLPKGKPIYYSDVVANFMEGISAFKLSFNINNLTYRFPGGELGLRNITFSESQGKLVGIMGASGAGKTTLLNVLCGIYEPSDGEVLINGINLHKERDKIEGVIGYIPQDDLLIEELTVFENLYYNAKLCFNDKTDQEITDLVEKTLQSLGLFERKNLKVGSPLNKLISGGQRKRLNIALELIREPSILFVDEPTSGLSSRDSENVMDLLSELTLKGKLIFVVIHQPSSDIYKMFDKMIILDTGGYMIYYGNPVEAVMYFKRIDIQINSEVGECPTCGNVNPEIIFNIVEARVVDEFGKYTNTRKITPPKWEDHFRNNIKVDQLDQVKEAPPKSTNIPTWVKQFKIYTLRDFFSKVSNMQYVVLTLVEAPLLGFILSFIIRYIVDPNSSIYIFRENENIPPYIFMSIVVALFLGLTVSAEEIFRDRKILKREKFLNLSRSSYLVSKVLILIVLSAIQSFLYVIVGNNILHIGGMTFYYWFALFTTFVFANMLGLNISATFNSAVTIYILIPLLMIPQMALGGAMFSFDKLNRAIGTIGKVPLIAEFMTSRWTYEALMVHQFKNNEFEKYFFDIERIQQIAYVKQAYYIPEITGRLDACVEYINRPNSKDKASIENNFELIKNELRKEKMRLLKRKTEIKLELANSSKDKVAFLKEEFNTIKTITDKSQDFFKDLNLKNFTEDIGDDVKDYITGIDEYYGKVYAYATGTIEKSITQYNETKPGVYNALKKAYMNEALSDIVRKVLEHNKMLVYKTDVIQNIEPIFLLPSDDDYFSFRCQFYAPKKHFMGHYFETYWFNMVIVWLISIFLYITLYYEHLKKLLDLLGKIETPRFMKKINLGKYLPKRKLPEVKGKLRDRNKTKEVDKEKEADAEHPKETDGEKTKEKLREREKTFDKEKDDVAAERRERLRDRQKEKEKETDKDKEDKTT